MNLVVRLVSQRFLSRVFPKDVVFIIVVVVVIFIIIVFFFFIILLLIIIIVIVLSECVVHLLEEGAMLRIGRRYRVQPLFDFRPIFHSVFKYPPLSLRDSKFTVYTAQSMFTEKFITAHFE